MHIVLRLVHIFFACITLQQEVYTRMHVHDSGIELFIFLRRDAHPNHFIYTSDCNVTQVKKNANQPLCYM